jgi:hypothetical protein
MKITENMLQFQVMSKLTLGHSYKPNTSVIMKLVIGMTIRESIHIIGTTIARFTILNT